MAAGDVILVLSPPGAIDAKGNYKNSIPVSSLITTGGEMMFYGFNLTWVDGNNITIGVGSLSLPDGASQYKSTLASPLTISIDASGAGGLDTGTKQIAWYYIWYIVNKTSGASSAVFSLSATSPTLPTGYTLKRRIGSIYNENTTGARISKFLQSGNGPDKIFTWTLDRLFSGGMFPGAKTYISLGVGASPLATRATIRTVPGDAVDPGAPVVVGYYSRSVISALAWVSYIITNPYPVDVTCLIENGEIGYQIGNGRSDPSIVSWEESM